MMPQKGSGASKLIDVIFSFPIASRDYTPIMIELAFPASITVSCVNISISGDLDLEDNEVFTVQLDSSDQAILFRPSSATVTITDDDSKARFIVPSYC